MLADSTSRCIGAYKDAFRGANLNNKAPCMLAPNSPNSASTAAGRRIIMMVPCRGGTGTVTANGSVQPH
jgi:hypothetical protein